MTDTKPIFGRFNKIDMINAEMSHIRNSIIHPNYEPPKFSLEKFLSNGYVEDVKK